MILDDLMSSFAFSLIPSSMMYISPRTYPLMIKHIIIISESFIGILQISEHIHRPSNF